jgi:hypothetical protein
MERIILLISRCVLAVGAAHARHHQQRKDRPFSVVRTLSVRKSYFAVRAHQISRQDLYIPPDSSNRRIAPTIYPVERSCQTLNAKRSAPSEKTDGEIF